MADIEYDVYEAKTVTENTKDIDQGKDSPRWTPSEPVKTVTKTQTYNEGDVWAGGPSLTNEFEVIEDDLVKTY